MTPDPSFANPAVEAKFSSFPKAERTMLLALRQLIFETAESLPEVGRIEETLKWGQPSYLTPQTKAGSTLRLGLPKKGGIAIFAHCQTTIVSDFRTVFPNDFEYDGNRGVYLPELDGKQLKKLRILIVGALTYHLKKRLSAV